MGILNTILTWDDKAGNEHEARVTVHYDVDEGYAGDRIDPPCDPTVYIAGITGMSRAVPSYFYEDDNLKAECMADWHDDKIAAGEYRAEQRADDLMREHWQ